MPTEYTTVYLHVVTNFTTFAVVFSHVLLVCCGVLAWKKLRVSFPSPSVTSS